MPWLSVADFVNGARLACEKLGQPQPASNLVSESNSLLAAANAVVAAISQWASYFAGEGAFGGGVARDLRCHGLCVPLAAQDFLPFGFGFLIGWFMMSN